VSQYANALPYSNCSCVRYHCCNYYYVLCAQTALFRRSFEPTMCILTPLTGKHMHCQSYCTLLLQTRFFSYIREVHMRNARGLMCYAMISGVQCIEKPCTVKCCLLLANILHTGCMFMHVFIYYSTHCCCYYYHYSCCYIWSR
jgi:hypothetical protein